MSKQLEITDDKDKARGLTHIRVQNFWIDGKTGKVQMVCAKVEEDGTPIKYIDVPMEYGEDQLAQFLTKVLQQAQKTNPELLGTGKVVDIPKPPEPEPQPEPAPEQ